jgi:hypothetical protein
MNEAIINARPTNASTLGAPNIPNKNRSKPTTPNSEPARPAVFDIPVEFPMELKYQNPGLRRYTPRSFMVRGTFKTGISGS